MTNKVIVYDPPSGWKYGFPKAIPRCYTIHYGGNDYGVSENFNVIEWLLQQGYPQSEIDACGDYFYCKWYTADDDEK